MAAKDVPVTSIGNLDSYGLMTPIAEETQRNEAMRVFKDMYAPAIGTGPVMDYIRQTVNNVMGGADIIKDVPGQYTSQVEYAANPIAQSLRDVARVHLAGLGTRIFYVIHGGTRGYDTHANELPNHATLWTDLSAAIMDFFQDLRDHDSSEEVVMLVFTEFGRRIQDNGTGTDHGSGGGAFLIGDRVKGGLYAEYPPLDPSQWEHGEDLKHTFDFRGMYGTLIEQWMGLDPVPIVSGTFEQISPFK